MKLFGVLTRRHRGRHHHQRRNEPGDGNGTGDGDGYGDSDGYGYGDSDGYGNGDSDGYGDGDGYGDSDGYGNGDGYGDGDGTADASGPSTWHLPTCVTPTGAPGLAFGPSFGKHLHVSKAAMQLRRRRDRQEAHLGQPQRPRPRRGPLCP